MTSERLFYDDEFQSLRCMIEQGKGYKKTACFLWPSMKPESAYQRLKVCCMAGGDQRLKLGEILVAMKFNERYDPLYYLAEETMHERPAQRKPEDHDAHLAAVIEQASATMRDALGELARIRGEGRG